MFLTMNKMLLPTLVVVVIIGCVSQASICAAFHLGHVNPPLGTTNSFSKRKAAIYPNKQHSDGHQQVKLYMSNQFDISKPVFDPLSLRAVRGDAIVRYDATNQSEPLRIVLFALFGATLLSAPFLVEAVGYDPMNTPATIASVILATGSGALFVRECTRRASQLTRIEKELNTESLPIRLPTNPFSEMPFSKAITLKNLRATKKPPRIIAICGNQSKLTEALSSLAIYRRRLTQASVLVVAISTDGSTAKDWQVLNNNSYKSWLADSYQPQVWVDYFRALTDEKTDDEFDFRWFGLNANGRSFGSGDGEMQIIQLMGQFLRPTDFLDVSDDDRTKTSDSDTTTTEKELLETAESFYSALTTGNQDAIESLYSQSTSKEVSEVIDFGGRIDTWKDCLAEGARPSDMQVSGADVTILSDTEAYTTCIEFPANTGMDSASLLAIQRFVRADKQEPWKLDLHQTIPWSLETKAQGTLQCDCRGCVALTRGKERRTFGGIIG